MSKDKAYIEILANDFLAQYYIDILRSEGGVSIDIYFDNTDIRSMIEGMKSYDTTYKFERNRFMSSQTLVHSLVYFGWMNNGIKVLPPHQDELIDYLSKTHMLNSRYIGNERESINHLLYSVGLTDIDNLKTYVDNNEIHKYLENFKFNSIDLFKVNYLLKDYHWHDRLKKLISFEENSIISIDEISYDLERAIKTELFNDLWRNFEKVRKEKSKNNFRDALSLTLINQKIKDFNKHKKKLPIFYASSYTINNLSPNLTRQFEIKIKIDGKLVKINVLRDSNFFILDVLFNIRRENDEDNKIVERMNTLRNRYTSVFTEYNASEIENEINELLFKDKVFVEFWFKKIQKDNLHTYISELVSYDFFKSDLRVLEEMESAKKHITSKLSKNLDKLKLIEDTWQQIDEFPKDINVLFKNTDNVNIFTDLGLTRFSLVKCDEIQGIADTIFKYNIEGDNGDFFLTRTTLISQIVRGIYEKKYDELLMAIAIFWIFQKYNFIINVLNKLNYKYDDHYQLALIHAACIYPADYPEKEIVSNIIRIYEDMPVEKQRYTIWIGIGYIYYHIWKIKATFGSFIPEDIYDSETKKYYYYISNAMVVTEKAYKWLHEKKDEVPEKVNYRNRKYYYALNNLLYFKVRIEESSEANEKAWHILASELIHCKDVQKIIGNRDLNILWLYMNIGFT